LARTPHTRFLSRRVARGAGSRPGVVMPIRPQRDAAPTRHR
jgi:hypothetical protein